MPELSALIERMEGACGSDREIDAALMVALCGARRVDESNFYGPNQEHWSFGEHEEESGAWNGPLPHLTASMDAALAFAKRFGFYIRLEPRFHIDGERVDFISYAIRPRWADYTPLDDWFDVGEGRHADQALAILIASLKALQEREGEGRATDML